MSQIYAGSANYIPKATTKTIHSKPGKLRAILISTDSTTVGSVTLYDNTAGSGTILLVLDSAYPQRDIFFDKLMPLIFEVGLTIVTTTNVRCFVITEA